MPTRRALLTLLAAAAASACSTPAAYATGSLVDLQIVDRARSETLPAYRYRGASYVAGRPGDRYAVRLTNRSNARVLVVLSIDGVNAVSGETASTGQTGYVLGAYQTAEITGWRKSYTEAAAFCFTALPDSYAARTDRPDNVGVIGAAVFRERVVEPPFQSPSFSWRDRQPPVARELADAANRAQETDRRAEPSGTAGAADASSGRLSSATPATAPAPEREAYAKKAEKLGTGHGEREYSPTSQTAFERASTQPAELAQVRYDSAANLMASGVIARPRPLPRVPDPFPGFVADPG